MAADPREHALSHLELIFYGDLGMCGCGVPNDMITLVRDLLVLAPFHEEERWRAARNLCGIPGAYHFIISALTRAELLEHGSVLDGAWITAKGRWCLDALLAYPDWDDDDGPGYPHDGGECTDACWRVPASEEAQR
jgi:hypothetical protein